MNTIQIIIVSASTAIIASGIYAEILMAAQIKLMKRMAEAITTSLVNGWVESMKTLAQSKVEEEKENEEK